ncbi:hypothetical protein V8C34DRAFT_287417 [Trichoderma compactum]
MPSIGFNLSNPKFPILAPGRLNLASGGNKSRGLITSNNAISNRRRQTTNRRTHPQSSRSEVFGFPYPSPLNLARARARKHLGCGLKPSFSR